MEAAAAPVPKSQADNNLLWNQGNKLYCQCCCCSRLHMPTEAVCREPATPTARRLALPMLYCRALPCAFLRSCFPRRSQLGLLPLAERRCSEVHLATRRRETLCALREWYLTFRTLLGFRGPVRPWWRSGSPLPKQCQDRAMLHSVLATAAPVFYSLNCCPKSGKATYVVAFAVQDWRLDQHGFPTKFGLGPS